MIVIFKPLDFVITTNSFTSCADISRTCFIAAGVVHQLDGQSNEASGRGYAQASRVGRVAIALVIGDQHSVICACHNDVFPQLEGGVELLASRGVDGGVTATGVLSRQRGNLITIGNTQ